MKTARKRRLEARPVFARFVAIAGMKRFKISDLANEFEVSTQTVRRDLAFMQDRLGYVFVYLGRGDIQKGEWKCIRPEHRVL